MTYVFEMIMSCPDEPGAGMLCRVESSSPEAWAAQAEVDHAMSQPDSVYAGWDFTLWPVAIEQYEGGVVDEHQDQAVWFRVEHRPTKVDPWEFVEDWSDRGDAEARRDYLSQALCGEFRVRRMRGLA